MNIKVLPAQLANQIAAGEVVERPSSVVKELIENSLDAGATQIRIDISKGGAKQIKITDNGSGIEKNELCLALSRHATSKIHSLNDLENIASLGFRGEALASISSVSRLTLTSKTCNSDGSENEAWQAISEGRDMAVQTQPAAHPVGTTIDVQDLFFNTPARRKFLRTEKTEFTHIDEVVRRIALANFELSITLTHNGKVIRQYRPAKNKLQYQKRVAQICGQQFINHAIEIDCKHDDMHLWGWVAKPEFNRSQNDLSYSYVNGRMMRDKLINHAIRQSYADMLPDNSFPAFVLFLSLKYSDVDVNVHPAKHEVRFHQGRYVHDFIYSVVHKNLVAIQPSLTSIDHTQVNNTPINMESAEQAEDASYIKPLSYQPSNQSGNPPNNTNGYTVQSASQSYSTDNISSNKSASTQNVRAYTAPVNQQAATNYQTLMTPLPTDLVENSEVNWRVLTIYSNVFALIEHQQQLKFLSLKKIAIALNKHALSTRWQQGLVSQPLLLPLQLTLDTEQIKLINENVDGFTKAGIELTVRSSSCLIRQFPALLRQVDSGQLDTGQKDVSRCFIELLELLQTTVENAREKHPTENDWQQAIATIMTKCSFDLKAASLLLIHAEAELKEKFSPLLCLNSTIVDLTSYINQLES